MRGALNPNLPFRYGAAYSSNVAIAAGVTSQVFSAAANVNGAIVWAAELFSGSAAAHSMALLAQIAAPLSVVDGDILLLIAARAAGVGQDRLNRPVFIAAGKGLWFFSFSLEDSALRSVLYTLL